MYAKIIDGVVQKYPYTISDARKDHPLMGIPKKPLPDALQKLNMVEVKRTDFPSVDQKVYRVQSSVEQVDGEWTLTWATEKRPLAEASASVRRHRDFLLAQSDWRALPDSPPMPTEWESYRQALRDITNQSGFPYEVVWPTKPE